MKLNLIAISCLLAFSGIVQAQNQKTSVSPGNYQVIKSKQCQNKSSLITTEQAKDISAALLVDNLLLLQHFLSDYCVDVNSYAQNDENNPIYFARSNDALKYLLTAGVQPFNKLNSTTKTDMLTFFMLEEESNKKFIEKSNSKLIEKLKDFEKRFNIPNLSQSKVPNISYQERGKMLTTLLSEYKRNDYHHKDILNNSISTYALMASEPEILGSSLTLAPNLALLQKNKDNLSLFQIAMLPKHTVGSDEQKKLKNRSINNFIMSNLNEKNIGTIRYEDLNYADFASLLQDNNSELYSAIISKFPTLVPTRFNAMTNDEKNKAKIFFNNMDYVEKLKNIW